MLWKDQPVKPLDEPEIEDLLKKFYERVRADEQLGPVFSVVQDWDEHLVRLGEFWSSVALMSGKYKGNPLAMHLVHANLIRPEMFDRWLAIWNATTAEMLSDDAARLLQAKAARIAARFSLALFDRAVVTVPEATHERPFKTSVTFDETSLPSQLQQFHSVRSWSVIRVDEGQVLYHGDLVGPGSLVESGRSQTVPPDSIHRLEVIAPMKVHVEFFDQDPTLSNQHQKGNDHA
jgi:truncated hemoglobin YjbI